MKQVVPLRGSQCSSLVMVAFYLLYGHIMHEFSVATQLLEGLEAKARELGATRIIAINLVIGDRASIVDESFRFYFEALAPGTLAEGARLIVRRVPTRFHCDVCDALYVPTGGSFHCPTCGATGHVTSEGSEFLVESIEIEED
jgi:hydrogenase nickel incorporation protein HypA/HybF